MGYLGRPWITPIGQPSRIARGGAGIFLADQEFYSIWVYWVGGQAAPVAGTLRSSDITCFRGRSGTVGA